MLDAYIIDRIRREREERDSWEKQPHAPSPQPDQNPYNVDEDTDEAPKPDTPRGVIEDIGSELDLVIDTL